MLTPAATLQIVNFLDQLSAGLIIPQIPAQARALGCNHLTVGLIGAVYAAAQLLSGPLVGALSDLNGRRSVLLVSLILTSLNFSLIGLTSSAIVFILLNILIGITKHTQDLTKALKPYYAEGTDDHLFRSYGAGLMIGPVFGGFIVYTFPEYGFFIITFIVSMLLAVSAGLIRQLPRVEEKGEDKDKKIKENIFSISFHELLAALANNIKGSLQSAADNFFQINWNIYFNIFLMQFLMSLGVGIYLSNYVLFLKIKFSASALTTGTIIAILCSVSTLTAYLDNIMNFSKSDDYTKRFFQAGALLTSSLVALSVVPDIFTYVLFMIPLAVSVTVGKLINVRMILSKTEKDKQNAFLGTATTISAICSILSPLITGIVAQSVGVLSVINVAFLFTLVGTVKSYNLYSKDIKTEDKKVD